MKPDVGPSTLEFVFGDRFNLRTLLNDRLVAEQLVRASDIGRTFLAG